MWVLSGSGTTRAWVPRRAETRLPVVVIASTVITAMRLSGWRVEEHEASGHSVGDLDVGVAQEPDDDGPSRFGIEDAAGRGTHRRDLQLETELSLRCPFDEV